MNRFAHELAEEVYETRFSRRLPKHVAIAAHELMRVLLAARALEDVGVLGPIVRWASLPGRYGLPVDGKWHATFEWSDTFGATEIQLERR
jgi:hypothetical protein